jgi:hypothetical protein
MACPDDYNSNVRDDTSLWAPYALHSAQLGRRWSHAQTHACAALR